MKEEYRRDIEESDDILDMEGEEPVEFWEKKQRELVTSVVDYNLSTLAELVADGAIDSSPRYQRRLRWDNKRKSRLIESFLMNVPIPPIFLNEDAYGSYSVIDGKQRLSAITEFMRGRLCLSDLTVFSDINGLTFDELPSRLRAVIKTRPTIRAVIILRQSDEDVKFEVFQRLNTGGVRLNAQEIRNSAWPGPLNDLILEMSEHPKFHALLGIKNKSKSALYQEMRDAEFVLRFLAFKDNWNDFSGGMKRRMDEFMADNQRLDEESIVTLKEEFLEAIDKVSAAFGENAFHRWEPEKGRWRRQVLASLYDAQMFACQHFDVESLEDSQGALIEGLKSKFEEQEFRKVVDAATNTPSYFRDRIKIVKELIEEAGI